MSAATILLVDDDEVLGQVLQRVLSRQGWTVVQAGSVEQALRLAREHSPQLGLLDLCLPDGDGVDLAARLQTEVGRFPLILMTAYPLRLRDHPELARQFSRVLTKPLNLEELRRAVETTLAGAPAEEAPARAAPVFDPATATLAPRQPGAAPAACRTAPHDAASCRRHGARAAHPPRRRVRVLAALLGLFILASSLFLVLPVLGVPGLPNVLHFLAEKPKDTGDSAPSSIRIVKDKSDTFDVEPETMKELKVPPPVRVRHKAEPRLLELSGSLGFNPNRLARIQARFAGEIVEFGVDEVGAKKDAARATAEPPVPPRPLRFGDAVVKGQLLAVVWSKDLGEKKSELVDALVRLALDEKNLARFEKEYRAGNIPEVVVRTAQSAVSSDLNAIARARRTLHTWRVEAKEIKAVEAEAERIIVAKTKSDIDKEGPDKTAWARVEVRAPFAGTIVERNVAINAQIDITTVIFQVADMKRLAIYANAYEDDLRRLQELQAAALPQRVAWHAHLTSDPFRTPLKGFGPGGRTEIDRVGYILDPNQHTNTVIGLVNNQDENMRVGQFVTISVELPPPPDVVSVPAAALVEDGKESVLFVQLDPKKPRFQLKRVAVVQRFQGQAYIRSRLNAAQKKSGLSELAGGEWIITGSAVELKAALEEVQAKEKAKEKEEKEKKEKAKQKGKK